ncbi:MAG: zinc-binding alcohol dehydrogenase [Planctomycetes bacterium]|nr:zinc-binding alcohol dehydrogenase [Planctomycetota bacterium]
MPLPRDTWQVIFTGKEQAEFQRLPIEPPKAGEILVRATWTLISTGTETISYGRRFDAGTHWDNWVKYPFSTGYSHTGVVEAVGPEVTKWKVGDRVASGCTHKQFAVASQDAFFPIPEGVADRDAAWLSLSYVAQNGIRGVEHELGDDVAIVGMGPIGQLALQFVRLLGAREIIVIDPAQARLDMAMAHGATHALAVNVADALEPITRITGGRLCDVVYDITGNDRVFSAAQQLVRRRGKIGLIGDTGSPGGQTLTSAIIGKSLRIIATHGSASPQVDSEWSHWTRSNMILLFLRYLADGRMRLSDLNTHVFSPKDCQGAYQKLLHDRAGTMGCHFDWSEIV